MAVALNVWVVPLVVILHSTSSHFQWRLWAVIEAHKWRDLELNLSKTATKAIEF